MASHSDDPTGDPATDGANYDYRGGGVDRPVLQSALDELVAGDVRFDDYSRELYATDASAYEVTPIGVVLPRSTADVAAVVECCADRGIAVLPRGGGTSLAGQAVNEAVVLDFTRYMDGLLDVDPEVGLARAQSGAILGEIDEALAPHGLKFAPDPAWADKSALGGAIGNDSTGAHSLVYGKTDAYVESCEVVLADGTVAELGEIDLETLRAEADADAEAALPRIYAEVACIVDEERAAIEAAYPDLKRNVSGYNLDVLIEDAKSGSVNLARLLCGSEGTLAVITEATISLEPIPATKAVALLTYDDLLDAMADVEPILDHDPAAVEAMDDVLLSLARETEEFADVVGLLPDGTDSVLLVEFYAESDEHGRRQIADLLADRVPDADPEIEPSDGVVDSGDDPDDGAAATTGTAAATDPPRRAVAAMEAHDAETRARFWKMRKSGLPILLSRTTDAKHVSFVEDCAVPAPDLPEYVARFREILDAHDTFASFYAHAGPGVLHVRPLIDTKTVDGVEAMASIADAATDLVIEYGGAISGEHGDGRARTGWNEKRYGEHLLGVFAELKTAFDPGWLLNPGQVCGDVSLAENLRFDPDYEFDAGFEPVLDWDNENGFQGMVELCHGCGGCRGGQSTTGSVMCPTYRAANEESLSTRGRANLLRGAMSGDLPDGEQFDVEFTTEVLDLCIGCKGCAHDCPSEVDMAKLKAELTHEHHRRHGASLRDRLFANVETVSRLGSAFAPLSNWLPRVPGARALLERTVGIAADRTLPAFRRRSFAEWFDARGPRVSATDAERRALLLPDTYTNYIHPRAGRAAVFALEAAGIRVAVPEDCGDSGRPAFSKGFLGEAREIARDNVAALAPRVRAGWDVVVVEPADAVMLQSDYRDLLAGDTDEPSGTVAAGEGGPQAAADGGTRAVGSREAGSGAIGSDVEAVAANTYGIMEYVDRFRLDASVHFDAPAEGLTYHGHCHQKATKKDHHAVGVLRRAGYEVDPLDSGCCGMAGSFGYEAEHRSMSAAIARILYEQVAASSGETVVAPGASCRAQLAERPGAGEDATGAGGNGSGNQEPPHPVEKLAEAIVQ
jgi:FAD/FMN-containing dehydrogenase/Fe-S oxidoreductase